MDLKFDLLCLLEDDICTKSTSQIHSRKVVQYASGIVLTFDKTIKFKFKSHKIWRDDKCLFRISLSFRGKLMFRKESTLFVFFQVKLE